MEDKKSLASSGELFEIKGKASLLAAVDYYVSMQSDIFVSASPGNMHNALVSVDIKYSHAKDNGSSFWLSITTIYMLQPSQFGLNLLKGFMHRFDSRSRRT